MTFQLIMQWLQPKIF